MKALNVCYTELKEFYPHYEYTRERHMKKTFRLAELEKSAENDLKKSKYELSGMKRMKSGCFQ